MRAVPVQIAARLPAAAELFADRGVESTKIEDVAAATGVPKATLYYYFSGKEEILAFLFQDVLRHIADQVAIAAMGEGSARDRLVGVVRAQLAVMAEQPAVCRALTGELGRAGRVPALAAAIRAAYHAPVVELLHQGATDGSLAQVADADAAALMIFGAVTVTGLSHLIAGGRIGVDDATGTLVAVLLDGLGAH
ncbi:MULTISPECIES: TetR/AcrR family transcriptional regulator [Blastococcus]|jgi:TetR/AcrR family transcriptional regulator|uniref:TetR/AcrR family transcriptional regulator n=1 Tax=Blastococcus TaxID=38501 RepID=UPI0004BCAC30|nr:MULTISPECIES: TetR/AcrR family transcriptional regulator [Blastococcus]MCA0145444.1 TetR/AcrR family transcriptional regulator [Blastococcus sp. LR1]